MRAWSEFKWHEGDLEENADSLKDYGYQIGISVTQNRVRDAERFLKKMCQKDVPVYLWPLNGHYIKFLFGDYWVNNKTAGKTVRLLEKMEPLIRYPNVEAVSLDMESMPFVEHLMDREKNRDKLEKVVDVIQNDWEKDVMTMQWYWPGFSWAFNLPLPRNARRRLLMVYPSMSLTKFAPLGLRENFIKSAIREGIDAYGEVHVDVGAIGDTGVYKNILYPFCKLFQYGNLEKIKEDADIAARNGAKSVGIYNLDGAVKNLREYLHLLNK